MLHAIVHIIQQDESILQMVENNADRIQIGFRDQEQELPAVYVELDSNDPTNSKGATSVMDKVRVSVTAMAFDYGSVWRLVQLIREAIDQYTGNVFSGNDEVAIDLIRYVTENDNYYQLPSSIYQKTHIYEVHVKRDGSITSIPGGDCEPVTIIDQDDNEIATVGSGGSYQVLVVSEFVDSTLTTEPTDVIIDNPFV